MTQVDELRRVEVEWLDSVSLSGWRTSDEVERELEGAESMRHVTVGLLWKELDDRLVVVLSAGTYPGAMLDSALAIPRVAILGVRELRPAKARPARSKRPAGL